VIKTFADKMTQQFYLTGSHNRIPPDLIGRAKRKLTYLELAENIGDLQVPPSNRLHKLEGNRKDQFAIRINDQWRICFRFIDGDAYDVEITDYH
jgi:proteic killer suppression protein